MIGIFIGSFNPPTKAHLEIALKLQNKLEKIILVPVNSPDKYLVDMDERINMLRILARKNSFLMIDDIMKDYSYLNYRIIDLLEKKYHHITLIIGSDLLNKLDSFDNYLYLVKCYSFIVVTRDENVQKIIQEKYSQYQNNFTILEYHNEISSTMVREYINKKKNLKELADEDIEVYIKNHHLYF